MKSKTRPAADTGERSRVVIYCLAAIIAALGIAETTYLTATTLAGAHVVCGNAESCSQVLGSAYSKIRGIPLAGIGALGYFAAFSCATLAAFGHRLARTGLAVVVSVMFLTTLWLLYLQAFVLHAFCEYCLASAAMIFILAGLTVAMPPARTAAS